MRKIIFSTRQKFFGLLMAALACGTTMVGDNIEAAAAAQTASHVLKIDRGAIQTKAQLYKELQSLLAAKMQSVESSMKKETEELQKDASLMQNFSEAQKASFEKRHRAFRERAERMQAALISLKDILEKETNENTYESVRAIVEKLSKEKGWEESSIMVVDSAAIIYNNDKVVDITDQVIKKLNEDHPSISEALKKKIQEIGSEKEAKA